MRFLIIFLIVCLPGFTLIGQHTGNVPFVKGVYGNPESILDKKMSFNSLGINAIFVHSASLNADLYRKAKEQGVRVYVEFPTLNGKEYLKQHPEAWPINEKGERSPVADWFMGICLTDPGFRNYRIQQLKTILQEFPVDGIWLDYLHWHAQFETPNPILPETCFCQRCIHQFENEMDVQVPEGEVSSQAQWILVQSDSLWRLWRSRVLNGWVRDLNAIVKEIRPEALLGIYYCPWYPTDFKGAQYRTLGLDLKELAKTVDVFSPMLYHQMMDRPPSWVSEYTEWLGSKSGIRRGEKPFIWPIVQAENKPGIISTKEFSQVMMNGSRPPSTGIMMFSLHSLISDPEKLNVMKTLYRKE